MRRFKTFRSLVALADSASTARVLNLSNLHVRLRDTIPPDRTFFSSSALSRAIIVKHRLRPHERDCFTGPRHVATKLMLPIDPKDMSCGAYSVMVGQKGYDEVLARDFAIDKVPEAGARDRAVLAAIDALPSLDPFLVREHLRRRGFKISDEYFDISPADALRMQEFVENDVIPLVTLCFGDLADNRQAGRLAQKILASELDSTLEPLRLTLKMSKVQFMEGVFCWKGFLYYKWVLANVTREAQRISVALSELRIRGRSTSEESRYLREARARIHIGIMKACREVAESIRAYDDAFETLTVKADPVSFREFLLGAPSIFSAVGEKLGAVQHITSFWGYQFSSEGASDLTAPEWVDLFTDFENSLGLTAHGASLWVA